MGLSPAIHVLGRPMAVPGPFFFLNRRRRPSADALVRMAGDRSGSLTGSARQAPSLGPLFRARPHPGRCAGTSKVCGHPSAPCAAASALRHWPPRRGGRWLRTASAPGLRLPPAASPADSAGSRLCPLGSGYRRLCPPVAPPPSRPPTACARGCAPAPVPPGHLVLRLALGLLRVGLRPALRATAGSPPALLRPVAVGPPRTAPPAPCPPSSLGRLVAWVGCGLRSSRLGPGAALRAASLRPRPQATGADAVRGLPLDSGWRRQGRFLRLCVSCVS